MTQNAGVAAGSRWTDLVSLELLPRRCRAMSSMTPWRRRRQARRSDGKLPPHVMVYFAMAMALFAEDDYEEVAARLADTLGSWGCSNAVGAADLRRDHPGAGAAGR